MFVFFALCCPLTTPFLLTHLESAEYSWSHVTFFQFPRVVVMLDEDSLELATDCKEDLKRVVDAHTVEWFKAKYGGQ